jgi:hypothetical protein
MLVTEEVYRSMATQDELLQRLAQLEAENERLKWKD